LSIRAKLKQGWGYNEGPGQDVEFGHDGTNYFIKRWPDANPPDIAVIEAVELLPVPNWPGFRLAMMQSAAFLRIANASAPLFVMLNSVMWLIATDPTKIQETALIWNQLATIAQPTEAEITALNAIAATNQIPLQLNESGMIE
jgi:hypothetical protein